MLNADELDAMMRIRRAMSDRNPAEVTENILSWMLKTKNNKEFIEATRKVFCDYDKKNN